MKPNPEHEARVADMARRVANGLSPERRLLREAYAVLRGVEPLVPGYPARDVRRVCEAIHELLHRETGV